MKAKVDWRIIRIARIANNLSMSFISKESHVSYIYISQLERGIKINPSIDTISKICTSLNLTTPQLIELGEFYGKLNCCESKKYRLTLMKTLEMISKNID